ncbi:ligase-associated DNA damage response DEXH box helicase [Cognatilysobacter bugurensis]|uniref:DNA ligase-associated DEXH box helicase n=1 Tax=Cognatilysobacter bugurensis TaxID=543356 RepID=A0A918SUF5_9GAMM|nr:ligase-associated DNA damage response DEXH box helicase [Lysobacter bugurensis]GHA71928.1 DNA ligase-associated DEXH box helicase [Lysobacter bugurensis]
MRRKRAAPEAATDAQSRLDAWFATRGWAPLPFQRDVWARYLAGESGLLHTPTGSGKTLAALGGVLLDALNAEPAAPARTRRAAPPDNATPAHEVGRLRVGRGGRLVRTAPNAAQREASRGRQRDLKLLWITPLRALAADSARAIREPFAELGLDWEVGLRTGDASARDKRLARDGRLDALVTTPESIALLLSYADTAPQLASLQAIVIDEWHELVGNKRGVLLQLCLARLRALAPGVRIWGLSATLGNLDEARDVLLPHRPDAAIVSGVAPRAVTLESLVPDVGERFPWAGHLGLNQLPRVVDRVFAARTSLVFTNTRASAEMWHRALSAVWLEDPATLALHHGSISAALRAQTEAGLREGRLRCVVATSSLDLGVDFPAVDQVIQIGSPKGAARLLQRAGRAKHRPGEAGHVVCVPTHALELVEFAAVRRAMQAGRIESRPPPMLSLDVLAQHCVTLALGGGFDGDALYDEVRGAHAFSTLAPDTWQAVLDFIVQGGRALEHYPDYRRVVRTEDGRYVLIDDRRIALRHRLSIGTITSEGSVAVKQLRGGALGSVEETFIARLRPRDRFHFAGRLLELVRLEQMTAYVRNVRSGDGQVPKWAGVRMSLSTELARGVEHLLATPADAPELGALARLLDLQASLSALPAQGEMLVEIVKARDGQHLFVYPFLGRGLHEGLAALLSLRWGRIRANTFAYAANDYGFVLSPAEAVQIDETELQGLLHPEGLVDDLRESLNLAELARRQFREIARVAGLLPPSLPGRANRSMRQLQASSGLLYDVLRRYDPDHVLLQLADHEVLSQQLEVTRLQAALADCASRALRWRRPKSLTPLSFPLWAEGKRGELSTEDWKTRVQRAAEQLERRHARRA